MKKVFKNLLKVNSLLVALSLPIAIVSCGKNDSSSRNSALNQIKNMDESIINKNVKDYLKKEVLKTSSSNEIRNIIQNAESFINYDEYKRLMNEKNLLAIQALHDYEKTIKAPLSSKNKLESLEKTMQEIKAIFASDYHNQIVAAFNSLEKDYQDGKLYILKFKDDNDNMVFDKDYLDKRKEIIELLNKAEKERNLPITQNDTNKSQKDFKAYVLKSLEKIDDHLEAKHKLKDSIKGFEEIVEKYSEKVEYVENQKKQYHEAKNFARKQIKKLGLEKEKLDILLYKIKNDDYSYYTMFNFREYLYPLIVENLNESIKKYTPKIKDVKNLSEDEIAQYMNTIRNLKKSFSLSPKQIYNQALEVSNNRHSLVLYKEKIIKKINSFLEFSNVPQDFKNEIIKKINDSNIIDNIKVNELYKNIIQRALLDYKKFLIDQLQSNKNKIDLLNDKYNQIVINNNDYNHATSISDIEKYFKINYQNLKSFYDSII